MENDRVRQVAAAIVGILIIVVLVLLARWTGDQIRERFLTPKPAVVNNQPVSPSPVVNSPETISVETPSSTLSAIPETGPADFGYFLLGLGFITGSFLKLRAVLDRTG